MAAILAILHHLKEVGEHQTLHVPILVDLSKYLVNEIDAFRVIHSFVILRQQLSFRNIKHIFQIQKLEWNGETRMRRTLHRKIPKSPHFWMCVEVLCQLYVSHCLHLAIKSHLSETFTEVTNPEQTNDLGSPLPQNPGKLATGMNLGHPDVFRFHSWEQFLLEWTTLRNRLLVDIPGLQVGSFR